MERKDAVELREEKPCTVPNGSAWVPPAEPSNVVEPSPELLCRIIPVPDCWCGCLARQLASKTPENPGRAFFTCARRRKECGFYCWADEVPLPPVQKPEAAFSLAGAA